MLGQPANLHGSLLVQAVDVGKDLEQEKQIPFSGGEIEAPGTEVAARRGRESGLPQNLPTRSRREVPYPSLYISG